MQFFLNEIILEYEDMGDIRERCHGQLTVNAAMDGGPYLTGAVRCLESAKLWEGTPAKARLVTRANSKRE